MHDGPWPSWRDCAECAAIARRLAWEKAPTWSGKDIVIGCRIRLSKDHLFKSEPEWGTVVEIRLNEYLGEVWIATFEHGRNRVIEAGHIVEAKFDAPEAVQPQH